MSDFPPTTNSAINPGTPSSTTSKNKKKKNKKKNKKQGTLADSITRSEISSPALTDKENLDSIVGQDTSATASALPAAPIIPTTDADRLANNASGATGSLATDTTNTGDSLTKDASATASALPAAPITESASNTVNGASTTANDAATAADPLTTGASATSTTIPAAPITESGATDLSPTGVTGSATNASDSLGQDSSIPVKESTSSTTDGIPAAGPVGVGAAGATAAGAAAAAASLAVTSHSTSGYAGTGTTGTNATTTSGININTTKPAGGVASLPAPLPLSENVKCCIKATVGYGYIDVHSIVDKIKKNVAAGDYKEKAKLPPSSTAPQSTVAQPGVVQPGVAQPSVAQAIKAEAAAAPLTTAAPQPSVAQAVKAEVVQAAAPPATQTTAPPPIAKDNTYDTSKKTALGIGAAVAGTGAAIVGAVKSGKLSVVTDKIKGDKTKTDSAKINKTNIDKASPDKTKIKTDMSNLSENVQHCIQSAVNAPAVDVYGIINPSSKVKRPEPAVGAPTQPSMPSSAKAAHIAPPPKKGKSAENRKSGFASLKKKNCIIL